MRQLHMIWPQHRLDAPPPVVIPTGYVVRPLQSGEEASYFRLMARGGWPGWDENRLRLWRPRLLPSGWFVAVTSPGNMVVASAMALRDVGEFGEQGGELGWVVCDPAHRRRGLGTAVSAAATARLLAEGYRYVHLYTEEWRLPALRLYLRLGYVPLLDSPDAEEHWRRVYAALGWTERGFV